MSKKAFQQVGQSDKTWDGSHLVDAASAANAHKKGTCPSFAAVDAMVRLLDNYQFPIHSFLNAIDCPPSVQ